MSIFRYLAEFRYFEVKIHHPRESSKTEEKILGGVSC